ncbi:MAG: DUF5302 domain-containing protein [Actinomycetes bacterium]
MDETTRKTDPDDGAGAAQEANAEAAAGPPGDDDLRRKFREALDRKNHASHASAAEAESSGKAVAGHTNAKTQRMFRRKSGG